MKENENIIDYGSVTLPTSWEEVTLKQYADISRYYSPKEGEERKDFDIREVLHIFSNLPKDDIDSMPIEFAESMIETLSFLETKPNIGKPTYSLEVNGTKYQVNIQEKLRVGEYVAVTEMMKQDPSNYPLFLAILCRKPNEKYDSTYENEVIQERLSMFEGIPMLEGMRVMNFFLTSYLSLGVPTEASSMVKEEIDRLRKDIESLQKNGEVGKHFTKSAMKTLRKWEDTINSISTTT